MSKNPWKKNNANQSITANYQEFEMFQDEILLLIGACIRETCKEYKEAYKSKDDLRCNTIEKWFHSETFDLWTRGRINPDKLIEELQDQVNRKKLRVDKNRVREKRC